jgi:anaerobic magnesium-protoporphyrin IX monomethyl ester cyclase
MTDQLTQNGKQPNIELAEDIRDNLGTRRIPPLRPSQFPDAGASVQTLTSSTRPPGRWMSARQSADARRRHLDSQPASRWPPQRENMIWPQVSLAQLAALLVPEYTRGDHRCQRAAHGLAEVREAARTRKRPKYYLTQVTAPTLRNDMYGVFLAKSLGAKTMAFGTHVTPMTLETLRPFPALDFVLRGEPEMTLRELLDTWRARRPPTRAWQRCWRRRASPAPYVGAQERSMPSRRCKVREPGVAHILGLAWRNGEEIVINPDRPFIPNLDDLPMPLHELLPLEKQRMPMIKGPFTFIVTSRGCPAGCKYCIKHVSYQNSVRVRSAENIVDELEYLGKLGITISTCTPISLPSTASMSSASAS